MHKNKSLQKSKKSNNKPRNTNTVLARGGPIMKGSTAASYEVAVENPTRFEITGKGLAHSEWGPALRVSGRQQLCVIATTTGDASVFSVTGSTATVGNNNVDLAPYILNDRIAQVSALYQRYAFRNVRYTFITRVGTTQVGSISLAYSTDSGISTASSAVSLNYHSIQSIEPCKVFPFRKEIETLAISYSGKRTWYVDQDTNATATSEAVRQCKQGTLLGFPDLTGIGAINMGEIYIEYVMDLYVPNVVNTNITFLPKTTHALLRDVRKKFFSLKEEERIKFLDCLEKTLNMLL